MEAEEQLTPEERKLVKQGAVVVRPQSESEFHMVKAALEGICTVTGNVMPTDDEISHMIEQSRAEN